MTGAKRLLDDCFLHDGDRLRHDEALAILKDRVRPVARTETVPLEEASDRVLAKGIVSDRNIPGTDNSAVDGYAFCAADHAATGGFFPISARIAAGHPATAPLLPGSAALLPGSAARIFTGATMPEGADTVAMQEDCETHEQDGRPFVIVPAGLKAGANRRRAGEDVAAGSPILDAGTRLRPQELAAIASTGTSTVEVFSRLRVALVSTGDELRRPGAPLPKGGVYDSNHYLLRALLDGLGARITDVGILPDDPETVRAALTRTAADHDAILTTGGASRGDEDHLVEALDAIGKRHLWQLAIKPGRPMNFGQIGDCLTFGLPGNPVAAMVCFLLYVRPVLSVMGGAGFAEPRRFQVPADFSVAQKKPGRREFYRGSLATDAQGRTIVRKFERDGSGLITSLREADGLIEIPEDAVSVAAGEAVAFLPFPELGLRAR